MATESSFFNGSAGAVWGGSTITDTGWTAGANDNEQDGSSYAHIHGQFDAIGKTRFRIVRSASSQMQESFSTTYNRADSALEPIIMIRMSGAAGAEYGYGAWLDRTTSGEKSVYTLKVVRFVAGTMTTLGSVSAIEAPLINDAIDIGLSITATDAANGDVILFTQIWSASHHQDAAVRDVDLTSNEATSFSSTTMRQGAFRDGSVNKITSGGTKSMALGVVCDAASTTSTVKFDDFLVSYSNSTNTPRLAGTVPYVGSAAGMVDYGSQLAASSMGAGDIRICLMAIAVADASPVWTSGTELFTYGDPASDVTITAAYRRGTGSFTVSGVTSVVSMETLWTDVTSLDPPFLESATGVQVATTGNIGAASPIDFTEPSFQLCLVATDAARTITGTAGSSLNFRNRIKGGAPSIGFWGFPRVTPQTSIGFLSGLAVASTDTAAIHMDLLSSAYVPAGVPSYIGGDQVAAVYAGSDVVDAMYVGTDQVF